MTHFHVVFPGTRSAPITDPDDALTLLVLQAGLAARRGEVRPAGTVEACEDRGCEHGAVLGTTHFEVDQSWRAQS